MFPDLIFHFIECPYPKLKASITRPLHKGLGQVECLNSIRHVLTCICPDERKEVEEEPNLWNLVPLSVSCSAKKGPTVRTIAFRTQKLCRVVPHP